MTETMATVLTGILTLIGVVITTAGSMRKIESKLEINQAVFDTKLDNLTQEVRKTSEYAMEIPVIKQRLTVCEGDIKDLKDR